jgi:hypothetical protein
MFTLDGHASIYNHTANFTDQSDADSLTRVIELLK